MRINVKGKVVVRNSGPKAASDLTPMLEIIPAVQALYSL